MRGTSLLFKFSGSRGWSIKPKFTRPALIVENELSCPLSRHTKALAIHLVLIPNHGWKIRNFGGVETIDRIAHIRCQVQDMLLPFERVLREADHNLWIGRILERAFYLCK